MSDGEDLLHKKSKETLQSPLFDESKYPNGLIRLYYHLRAQVQIIFNLSIIFTELKTLSMSQLNELYLELELLIRDYSETLISELALRDELEYEKELKNSFISLLLGVQNRRRQYHVEKKKGIRSGVKFNTTEPKVRSIIFIQP